MFKTRKEWKEWQEYLELHQASDDEWEREFNYEADEEMLWERED